MHQAQAANRLVEVEEEVEVEGGQWRFTFVLRPGVCV